MTTSRTCARAVSCLVAVSATVALCAGPAAARSVTSRAAAGYQASSDTFRRVVARWTVSSLRCPGLTGRGDSDSYAWVGLGSGATDSERVGVREFCTGTLPAYVAFLEMNGLYEVQAIDPAPGDAIYARVDYSARKYHFALTDSTQHRSFSLAYSCGAFSFGQGTCSHTSAEVGAGIWAPRLSPLADYGRLRFTGIAITDAHGRLGTFAANRHWRTTRFSELDGSRIAASPSPLTGRGSRFTDTWHLP